jgi:hypothetical protein
VVLLVGGDLFFWGGGGVFDREGEFERAIGDLNELYSVNLANGDYKAALSVRKELNAMLAIRVVAESNVAEKSEVDAEALLLEIDTVRKHLEPLGLAEMGTPVSELARLAAVRIVSGG